MRLPPLSYNVRSLFVRWSSTLLTVVGIGVLWPSEENEVPQVLAGSGVERIDVTVDSVEPADCIGAPDSPIECIEIAFGLPDGGVGSFILTPSVSTPVIEAGDRIVVADQGGIVEERFRYFFLDFQRERSLILLVVLFAGAVLLLGRWQGLRSLIALALSFVVLVGFTLRPVAGVDSRERQFDLRAAMAGLELEAALERRQRGFAAYR